MKSPQFVAKLVPLTSFISSTSQSEMIDPSSPYFFSPGHQLEEQKYMCVLDTENLRRTRFMRGYRGFPPLCVSPPFRSYPYATDSLDFINGRQSEA